MNWPFWAQISNIKSVYISDPIFSAAGLEYRMVTETLFPNIHKTQRIARQLLAVWWKVWMHNQSLAHSNMMVQADRNMQFHNLLSDKEDVKRSLGSQLKPFVPSSFLQITSTASQDLRSTNKLSETILKTFRQLIVENSWRGKTEKSKMRWRGFASTWSSKLARLLSVSYKTLPNGYFIQWLFSCWTAPPLFPQSRQKKESLSSCLDPNHLKTGSLQLRICYQVQKENTEI